MGNLVKNLCGEIVNRDTESGTILSKIWQNPDIHHVSKSSRQNQLFAKLGATLMQNYKIRALLHVWHYGIYYF